MKPYKTLQATITKTVLIEKNHQVLFDSRLWLVANHYSHITTLSQEERKVWILQSDAGVITIVSDVTGLTIHRATDYSISTVHFKNAYEVNSGLSEMALDVSYPKNLKVKYNWSNLNLYVSYDEPSTRDVPLTIGTSRSYLATGWVVSHITELGSVIFTRDKPSDDIRQDEVFIRVNDHEMAKKFSIKFKE